MQNRQLFVCGIALAGALVAAPAILRPVRAEDVSLKTWAVNCDAGESINKTLAKVRPGDTISVVGTCVENVVVSEEVDRLVLVGNSGATIVGPDPALDTLVILGDDVVVRGFTITGGRGGVNLRGALNVSVEHNVIRNTPGVGVTVHRVSYAIILGNSIRENGAHGILLMENASARIGFRETTASASVPNTIEDNGADGVYMARSSNAWIAGNTISGNHRHGVYLEKMAQAEVMANTIDANSGHGIFVTQNSGAHLGSASGARWMDKPNTSNVANGGFAVQCSVGAYLVGQIGSLAGAAGPWSILSGCVNTAS
jgi:parallel beta-helix repeat protein